MALNHQHVYSTLRSALVDRDRDPTFIIDTQVIVAMGEDNFALKQAVPSGALLVAYTMLFRPGFMKMAFEDPNFLASGHYFLGGDENKVFPVFSNDVVASIAIAVGVYADIIQALPSNQGIMIRPNFNTPIVKETWARMFIDGATIADARDLFCELMQKEQYRLTVPLADDYIVNPFIAEFNIGIDTSIPEARRISADFGEL